MREIQCKDDKCPQGDKEPEEEIKKRKDDLDRIFNRKRKPDEIL